MVSPQNAYPSEAPSGPVRSDRGFVPDAPIGPSASSAVAPSSNAWRYATAPGYFWGSVVAGALFAMSLFVLSWFLMLGCHVGVTQSGMLAMGWGAGWWIVITSAIAFYFGGAIANNISRLPGGGWLKGAAVWGLSIPLALCIWGLVAGGSGLLAGLTMPHVDVLANAGTFTATSGHLAGAGFSFGAIWAAFLTLIVGLIFAIFGSVSTVPGRYTTGRSQLNA